MPIHEVHEQWHPPARRRVRHAGFLVGAGLAGQLQGAVLQDLLGWHHFVQDAGQQARATDGVFALVCIALTTLGVTMLWRARVRFAEPGAGAVLMGSATVGAGTLLLADAVVDRWLLRLHWLHPQGDVLAWELGDAAVSLALLALGAGLLAVATRKRAGAGMRRARHA